MWGLKEKFSPIKEYEVLRNDAETDGIVKRSTVVHDYRAGKVGMPHGICPTALSQRAASCSCKTVCFSGDHPPTYKWQEGP